MVWEADVLSRNSLLFAALAFSLAGCSWFSSNKSQVKPAELVAFKPSVELVKTWDAHVGTGGPFAFSPDTDGLAVYAAGREGKIVKLDLASGREIWRIDAGQTLSAGVGVGDGLVLVGTSKGVLLAFKSADGAPAWNAKLSAEILTPPSGANGVVAARSNDGKVYLLDSATGKQRWSYSRNLPALTLREQGHLQLGNSAVFAGHAGGKLTALALNNGAPLWEVNVALPHGDTELERIADVAGPLSSDGRLVCAAAFQGRVGCFDQISGNAAWVRDFSALRGVAMDERFVYSADDLGTVAAFEKNRGTNPWKQDKLRDRKLSSPVALAGRFVALGDFEGQIHLLNSEDGAFAARMPTDGSPINSVMIPLKSGLLVQTANGGIFAFRLQ
ncbi:MAG: outer membrane protein assembly factor BamB [Hydrogenophilales bacterium 28-61-23]|nr:MAG: outer membrane protein assembly factor BamB [Hydrogenophilales bacterium 28-61-23]